MNIRLASSPSAFLINRVASASVSCSRDEVLVRQQIDKDLMGDLGSPQVKLLVVANAGPFEHASNVLRKALSGSSCIALLGVGDVAAVFARASSVFLEIHETEVFATCDEQRLSFRLSDLGGTEVAEPIELLVATQEICYKPDYYYSTELGRIIAEGFASADKLWNRSVSTRLAGDGRVWTLGLGLPSVLCLTITENSQWYLERIAEYLGILRRLRTFSGLVRRDETFVELLREHFSYSTLFSFIVQHLMMDYQAQAGTVALEDSLELVARESPLGDKRKLTEPIMARLLLAINETLEGDPADPSSFVRVFGWNELPVVSPDFNVRFVTSLVADIRRGVINMLIEDSPWFHSICGHRRLPEIL